MLEKEILEENQQIPITSPEKKVKKWNFTRFFILGAISSTLILFILILATVGYSAYNKGVLPYSVRIIAPYLSTIPFFSKFIPHDGTSLIGEKDDRINILLMGMAGDGHDGPNLTDTILLASYKPSTNTLALMSLPRDLVVPVEGSKYWKKINSINANAEVAHPGEGGEYTRQFISKFLNLNIPYYIRVDFACFKDVVDAIGGITVDVDQVLDDYRYPIEGKENAVPYESRFAHIHFDLGRQWMDGARALSFARSRHGLGSQGSDFARSHRQQLVISAIKKKIENSPFLLNPRQTTNLLSILKKHISTNVEPQAIIRAKELWSNRKEPIIITKVISELTGEVVASVGDDGAFILLPADKTFTAIRDLATDIFSLKNPQKKIKSTVAIQNGTFISGLAKQTAADVETQGFEVTIIGNAKKRSDTTQTTIYDFTSGKKNDELEKLAQHLHALIALNEPLPNQGLDLFGTIAYAKEDNPKYDFLVVVGIPPQTR